MTSPKDYTKLKPGDVIVVPYDIINHPNNFYEEKPSKSYSKVLRVNKASVRLKHIFDTFRGPLSKRDTTATFGDLDWHDWYILKEKERTVIETLYNIKF